MGTYTYMRTTMHGFSARAEPSRIEAVLAAYARDIAMPSSARTLKNPVRLSLDVQHEAMAHFADHCAVCHANNGSGQTMFGKGMYPKPPDLRQSRTQNRTDGEIFSISRTAFACQECLPLAQRTRQMTVGSWCISFATFLS